MNYGEMISMYSDTSNADIYLNNSLELGTSGAEGACAGVERAIDIMVSGESEKATDDVADKSVVAPLLISKITDTEHFNQEPLPVDQQYAATFSQSITDDPTREGQISFTNTSMDSQNTTQSDLEIDLSQMTPNLKRAVELLRHKYNISKMSREATPVPPELADTSQMPEGYIMNNDSLPESANMHMNEDIMEEVQQELETVMDELSKMELYTSIELQDKRNSDGDQVETRTARSNSNSSEADTLVGTSADLAQPEKLDESIEDDDDSSGEQMIFGMDDVFVKVVTTKDGRIKKIKIMEGKEGGDTKKIVNPQTQTLEYTHGSSDSGEHATFHDERYFTHQFYQDDFLAGDDQYQSESNSEDQDSVVEATEHRTTPISHQYNVGDEIDVVQRSQQAYRDDINDKYFREIPLDNEAVRGSPDYTSRIPILPYHSTEHYSGDHIQDDSTDSETSDDDDDDYYEGDERESPMRSLSPIQEEAEAQSTRGSTPVLPLPARQVLSDSSDDENDDQNVSSHAKYSMEQKYQRHSESDDDELEVLKEIVRKEQLCQMVVHRDDIETHQDTVTRDDSEQVELSELVEITPRLVTDNLYVTNSENQGEDLFHEKTDDNSIQRPSIALQSTTANDTFDDCLNSNHTDKAIVCGVPQCDARPKETAQLDVRPRELPQLDIRPRELPHRDDRPRELPQRDDRQHEMPQLDDRPSGSPVDPEIDIMSQKLALEGFLSSLGKS